MNYMTEKIRKNSKMVKTLLRIAIAALAIVLFIQVFAVAEYLLTGDLLKTEGITTVRINLDGNIISPENSTSFTLMLFYTVLQTSLFLAVLLITESIFRLIQKSESPFIPEVPKRMKRIAVLLLLAQILPRLTAYIARWSYNGKFGITIIDEGTAIFIIIAMILYCFAAIFEHGCILQKESDETL